MTTRRFKNAQMQSTYDTCRELAAAGKMGQIHGSIDDNYHRGLKGFPWKGARDSLAYAAWAAGTDDQKATPC